MFVLWSSTVGKGKVNEIRRASLLGFCLVYAVLAILGPNVTNHLLILAISIGVINGSYWFPYHVQRFDSTHLKNRGNYAGLESAIKTTVSFVAPLLGGFVIGLGGAGYGGYQWLFSLASVFFLLSFFLSDDLPLLSVKAEALSSTFQQIKRSPNVLKVFFSGTTAGFGLGNGALSTVLIPLLIFKSVGMEFGLGSWLSVFALAAILTSLTVGKYIHFKHYDTTLTLGALLLILAFGLLLLYPSFFSILIYGAVESISFNLMEIPRRVYSENLLLKVENYQDNRVGYIVIREIFNIGLGMTSSFILLYFLADVDVNSLNTLASLVVLATITQVVLLRSIKYRKLEFSK